METKTTHAIELNPEVVEAKPDATEQVKPENDPRYLSNLLIRFNQEKTCAENRRSRIKLLMERKSAKAWPPLKTQKMVRRLMAADKEFENADSTIDQVRTRLEQISRNELPEEAA